MIHGRDSSDRVWNVTPWPKGKEKQWERLYQKRAFVAGDPSQKGENRVDFLLRFSTQKMRTYQQELKELEYINMEADLTEESLDKIVKLRGLIEKSNRYIASAERARQMKVETARRLQRKRDFANRKGGLGREMESTLWELVND